MPDARSIVIRPLETIDDLRKVSAVEQEVWGLVDRDLTPITLTIATHSAGSIWLGAFDGDQLVGFAFGFPGVEAGHLTIHSHMLAVREPYRHLALGYKLKLAQRERVLALRIREMTWTFDPLQSRNAHLNFSKLGVVSQRYIPDFYGKDSSSVLHQNSTDRLWVRWPLASRRVQDRIAGKSHRVEILEILSRLLPLIQFNGNGAPHPTDLAEALGRQRVAIEIPSDTLALEKKDAVLAREWREATRWAFIEALKAGFFIAEFCSRIRGQQGPGAYLLEKGTVEEYVPDV